MSDELYNSGYHLIGPQERDEDVQNVIDSLESELAEQKRKNQHLGRVANSKILAHKIAKQRIAERDIRIDNLESENMTHKEAYWTALRQLNTKQALLKDYSVLVRNKSARIAELELVVSNLQDERNEALRQLNLKTQKRPIYYLIRVSNQKWALIPYHQDVGILFRERNQDRDLTYADLVRQLRYHGQNANPFVLVQRQTPWDVVTHTIDQISSKTLYAMEPYECSVDYQRQLQDIDFLKEELNIAWHESDKHKKLFESAHKNYQNTLAELNRLKTNYRGLEAKSNASVCPVCKKALANKSGREQHMQDTVCGELDKLKVVNNTCPSCKKSFASSGAVKDHMRMTHVDLSIESCVDKTKNQVSCQCMSSWCHGDSGSSYSHSVKSCKAIATREVREKHGGSFHRLLCKACANYYCNFSTSLTQCPI